MQVLENIDQQLFFFINHTLHVGFLDTLMPYWRSMYLWLPLYAFFIAYLIVNYGKKGGYLVLALLLTVGVSDIVSSCIVKNTVERLRPCNDPDIKDEVKLLVRCGSGYSFTSSHAANHFAVAIFLFFAYFYHKKYVKWALIAWAASIGFGQIYVGVHYPFDVLFGAILGSVIGYLGYQVVKKYFRDLILV
jgi:membrane-associated phospholipid phosphatase